MTFGDIDPAGGFIGLAALIVGIIGLLATTSKAHSEAIKFSLRAAIGLAVIATIFLSVATINALTQTSYSGESAAAGELLEGGEAQGTPSPLTVTTTSPLTTAQLADGPSETVIGGDEGAEEFGNSFGEDSTTDAAPAGPVAIELEVLTSDYRRKNLAGTEYAIPGSSDRLEFRFGWASHTPDGDLETDDCSVNTRLSDASGVVLISNPSNQCSQTIGPYAYRELLEPGVYTIQVSLQHPSGTSLTEEKTIRVDAN